MLSIFSRRCSKAIGTLLVGALVIIENMQYAPRTLSLKPGESVTWENRDLVPHTVTSKSGEFDSKTIAPGGKWTFQMKKKGLFQYKCDFHPTMEGSLRVQ